MDGYSLCTYAHCFTGVPKINQGGVLFVDPRLLALQALALALALDLDGKRVTLSSSSSPHPHVLQVDVREYYTDKATGEYRPGYKGVTLNPSQWKALKDAAEAVDAMVDAIK